MLIAFGKEDEGGRGDGRGLFGGNGWGMGDESALPFLVTKELKTSVFTSLQTPEPLCVCLCSLSP